MFGPLRIIDAPVADIDNSIRFLCNLSHNDACAVVKTMNIGTIPEEIQSVFPSSTKTAKILISICGTRLGERIAQIVKRLKTTPCWLKVHQKMMKEMNDLKDFPFLFRNIQFLDKVHKSYNAPNSNSGSRSIEVNDGSNLGDDTTDQSLNSLHCETLCDDDDVEEANQLEDPNSSSDGIIIDYYYQLYYLDSYLGKLEITRNQSYLIACYVALTSVAGTTIGGTCRFCYYMVEILSSFSIGHCTMLLHRYDDIIPGDMMF